MSFTYANLTGSPWENWNSTGNLSVSLNGSSTVTTAKLPFSVTGWTIGTLFVCGIGGLINILVLVVTWPRRGDKSGVNLLIFHFILVNLLNCLVHVPIRGIMVQARQAGYVASLAVCYPIQALNGLNWLVVFWADNSLGINRCVALFFPHHYKWYASTRNNVLQITAVWIICTSIALNYELRKGVIVVMPIGHCAARGGGQLATALFITCKNVALGLGGIASVLVLAKCYLLSRRNTVFGAAIRPAENDQNAAKLRNRVRLALGLVVTYTFSAVTSSSSAIIIIMFPTVFTDAPLANLWLQTVALAQYVFPACIIFFSNPKYLARLKQLWKRTQHVAVEDSRSSRMHGSRVRSVETAKTTSAIVPASSALQERVPGLRGSGMVRVSQQQPDCLGSTV